VTVNTTGSYTFTNTSNIYTYGYICQGSFYPSSPCVNMFAENDQDGGNNQFPFTVSLRADTKYILVVTTYIGNVIGSFSVDVSGPNNAPFIPVYNL
jgi:hypothetical protein